MKLPLSLPLLCSLLSLAACLVPEPEPEPDEALESSSSSEIVALADTDGDGWDASDCNNFNAAIHPNLEESSNGVDDNCDGRIDEPTLRYLTMRPFETQAAPQLPWFLFRITDSAALSYLNNAANAGVSFRLIYQRLSSASGLSIVAPMGNATIAPSWTWPLLQINPNSVMTNLAPMTVYRMKVQLYTTAGAALGAQSDWFYSVTGNTSTSPSTAQQLGRIDVVLQALVQLGESKAGFVGKGGSVAPNGSRYTASSLTPLHPSYNVGDDLGWCDWFYHYVGVKATDPLDGSLSINPVVSGGNDFWHTMNPNNVPNAFRDPFYNGCGTEAVDLDGDGVNGEVIHAGCQSYEPGEVNLGSDNQFYSNIPSNVYYHSIRSLPQNQGIGNYQAMDHHAGMFLAFDPNGDGTSSGSGTVGTVWSIEGNVGNQVAVMSRPANSTTINGFGKLTPEMFDP
jgi:Putative metal-binding motif